MVTHLELDILECEVKWAFGSIAMNKGGGSNGIPAELFKILKDDAVKVLHSICQQIWKTQQWPQQWKRSVFFPTSKKGNAKEYSNYHTVALISHASRASLVARLVKNLPAMQEAWFRSLGWEDPLKKGKATHSNTLACRIPWTTVHGVAESDTTTQL